MRLNDANHIGFLISQVHHVEQMAYEIKRPDIQYRRLVYVDTSASEWARGITHFSSDFVGEARPLNHMATDMPLVDLTKSIHQVDVEMVGIGYGYTIEELQQAMMVPGTNLTVDKAKAAIRASEEFIDRTVLDGNPDQGWDGLINNSNVTAVDAPAGAGGGAAWTGKTPDEIIADVNALLTGVFHSTRTTEIADTLALPVERLSHLANTRIPDSNMSILGWLRTNNQYTFLTGQPLMVTYIRGLESASAGAVIGHWRTATMRKCSNSICRCRTGSSTPSGRAPSTGRSRVLSGWADWRFVGRVRSATWTGSELDADP